MWKWGLEARASGTPVPLVRMPGPPGMGPELRPTCRCQRQLDVVMDGEISPRRRGPTGTPPGALGSMLSVWGYAGWKVFRKLVPGIAKGLRTTRWMPGASCPSANVWGRDGRSVVTPKRAPILAFMGRACGRRDFYEQAMGWLAQERNSRVGPGPWGMVWPVLRTIHGWRLPALRYAVSPKYSDWDMAVIRRR